MNIDLPSIINSLSRNQQPVSINKWEMDYPNISNEANPFNKQTRVPLTSSAVQQFALRSANQHTTGTTLSTRFHFFKKSNEAKRNFGDHLPKTLMPLESKEELTWNESKYKMEEPNESSDKYKTKFLSLWNNMRHGWTVKLKTNFNYDSAIWLLGEVYHKKNFEDSDPYSPGTGSKSTSMENFRKDFESRLWFTYRREFPPLRGATGASNRSSDCGWGCMLRSGQMLLAQGLVCHFLGRDWRWSDPQTDHAETLHRTIVRWFGDHLCAQSPFSIHQLVRLGESGVGKRVGDWYGPATVALVLKQAVEQAADQHPLLQGICVYIAQDCTIYKEDVIDLCTRPLKKPSSPLVKSSHLEQCETAVKFSSLPPSSSPASSFYYVPDDPSATASEPFSSNFQPEFLMTGSFLCVPPAAVSTLPSESPHSSRPLVHAASEGDEPPASLKPSPSPTQKRPSPGLLRSFSVPASTSNHEEEEGKEENWRSVIILIPVRLGGEKFNHFYIPLIRDFLAMKNVLGIIGGRPKHSLYFVGWQDDRLVFLDPHFCQDAVDVCTPDFPLSSFHCPSPRKLPFSRMDPSCTLGFYCRTRKDFEAFTQMVGEQLPPYEKVYPIFTVSSGRCSEAMAATPSSLDSMAPPMSVSDISEPCDEQVDEDDFVIL